METLQWMWMIVTDLKTWAGASWFDIFSVITIIILAIWLFFARKAEPVEHYDEEVEHWRHQFHLAMKRKSHYKGKLKDALRAVDIAREALRHDIDDEEFDEDEFNELREEFLAAVGETKAPDATMVDEG